MACLQHYICPKPKAHTSRKRFAEGTKACCHIYFSLPCPETLALSLELKTLLHPAKASYAVLVVAAFQQQLLQGLLFHGSALLVGVVHLLGNLQGPGQTVLCSLHVKPEVQSEFTADNFVQGAHQLSGCIDAPSAFAWPLLKPHLAQHPEPDKVPYPERSGLLAVPSADESPRPLHDYHSKDLHFLP